MVYEPFWFHEMIKAKALGRHVSEVLGAISVKYTVMSLTLGGCCCGTLAKQRDTVKGGWQLFDTSVTA